jgi:ABC-type nitrate/sulfonate/bicarbonate transport system substrate-binding protein
MKLANRRFVLAVFIFLSIPLRLFANDQITVAMLPSPTNAPFRVALDSGALKEQGLEVLPVQFTGGTQTIMGLMSGDVQVTTTGGPAAINAKLKGGNVVLFATIVGVFPYTFYVSDKIQKPEELRGKKVGIAGFDGVLHNATGFALRKLGLAESDVTMVQIGLPFANHIAAMASGSIQAALFQFPETKKANEMGFKPVVNLAQSGIKFPTSQMTTTRDYLANNRDRVKKFMKGFIAGLARLKGDKAFTMSVLRKFLDITDPEILAGTYDFWVNVYSSKPYVDPEEIKTYLTTLKDKGTAKPEDFLDNSIVAELDREGFIDSMQRKGH